MKELFYTSENIDQTAAEYIHELQPLRDLRKNIVLHPKKVALLVLDMQQFFFSESSHAYVPSMAAIVPKLKQLQTVFIKHNLTVLQTQHGNTNIDAKNMSRWWGGHILGVKTPEAAVISQLQDTDIPIIHKSQYDAFWETALEEKLKKNGIEQIIITGVMTHLCCETTARSAFVRGFDVFIAVDGTASYNQDFHLGSLRNLAHGVAKPMLCNEIMEVVDAKV